MAIKVASKSDRVALDSTAGDLASPQNGDLWYNGTSGKFRKRENGVTSDLEGGNGTVTNARLADMANATIKANRSGSAGAPQDVTIQQLFDLLDSTQGVIAYRGPTGWLPLAPGSAGQVLQTGGPSANPSWAAAGGGPDSRAPIFQTDFAHANAVQNDFIMAAVSTGTFSTAPVALSPNHPGQVQLRSSTTANSGVQCMTQLAAFRIGGGEQFDINFFTAPVLTTVLMRAGASDSVTSTAPVDGVYFEMNASGVIVGKTRSNSVESVTATLATLTVSTWYHGRISVNAAATSVTFTVYDDAGVSLGTAALTTNIPTASGREFGWGAILLSSGVVAIELGHWDRIRVTNPGRTVARGAA